MTGKMQQEPRVSQNFEYFPANDYGSCLGRPMSPHLGIYVWSIPMTMSALNRIFAFALTFGFLAIPLVDVYTGDFCATIASLR